MSKGILIVIDGTDGSGKTVQTELLYQKIKNLGLPVETLSFPRYESPASYFVKKNLAGEYGMNLNPKAASILYAVDRFDDAKRIHHLLENGTILLSNRYVSANKGHQMGKINDPKECEEFLGWLNNLEYSIFGLPKPNLTLFLHVPAAIGKKLAEQRDGEASKKDIYQNDLEHLLNAERAYLQLQELDKEEHWEKIECTKNDELLSIEDIHESIWNAVSPLIER